MQGIFFLLIKPTMDATAAQQAIYDANYPDSTPQAQAAAQKTLSDAKVKVQLVKSQYAAKSSAIMPPYDVSDRNLALRQITYELTQHLGPDIQHQLHSTGVRTTTQVMLPAPPLSPNDITAAPVVVPLGTITVSGDFRHILTHFYDWQSFNRLVLVDNLALTGSSPYMTGTYTATLYIFPQNDDKLGPPIAGAGGGAAATSGRRRYAWRSARRHARWALPAECVAVRLVQAASGLALQKISGVPLRKEAQVWKNGSAGSQVGFSRNVRTMSA